MTTPMASSLCGICFSTTNNKAYKLLPCQHSFCEPCLQDLLLIQTDGSYVLGCPTCQYPVTLPSDGTLGLPTIDPTIHQEEQGHGETFMAPICSRHNKRIQLFCETCEQVTCNMCAIEDHQEHQYYVLIRNLQQHKHEVQNGLEQVKVARESCNTSLLKINEREKEIERQCKEIKDEIQSLTQRLVQLIHTSEGQLLQQLDKIKQQKLDTLLHQKREGEQGLSGLNKCCEYLEGTLSSSTPPHTFLSNKKIMNEMVVKFTNKKIEFEPVERADLKFKGNGSLLVLNKTLGHIQHTFLSQYCQLSKTTPTKSATPTQQQLIRAGTTTVLELTLQDHVHCSPSLFKCTLNPQDNDEKNIPISCLVEELSQGTYALHVAPIKDGLHHLVITLGGQPIPNSPFRIPVASSLGIERDTITLQIIPNFKHPWGVATNGEIVVLAEKSSHCIHILNANGRKIKTFGSKGKEDGNFTDPRGVAITPTNHILVTDYNRIQKLTLSGQCVRSICGKGSGPLQFLEPKGIAVHSKTGQILIADSGNHRIQVLNSDCTFSHSFGGGIGSVLRFPWDVTCDSEGFVYVVDNENHTVNKFTIEGAFVAKFGSKGSEDGCLNWPSAITYSTIDKCLYITDDNQRVSVFITSGVFVRKIEIEKGEEERFNHPIGVAVNHLGKVYVCDCWNNRLVIV